MSKLTILEPTELYSSEAPLNYHFSGWDKTSLVWPRNCGANLGQAGAYNLAIRAGLCPQIIRHGELDLLAEGDLVVVDVPQYGTISAALRSALAQTAATVLFTGNLSVAADILGLLPITWKKPSSAYNTFGAEFGKTCRPIQPADWGVYVTSAQSEMTAYGGPLFEIAGDRLDPKTALRIPLKGSFLLARVNAKPNRLLLNGLAFSALQAWLQGQEDLTQWLGWGRRQHWLDDLASSLIGTLTSAIDLSRFTRLNLGLQTFCFRHDNDSSIDPSFAALQEREGVEATYAVLHDENLHAWHEIKKKHPSHEYALHYTTIKRRYPFNKYFNFALSFTPLRGLAQKNKVGREVLAGDKLIKQVEAAKAAAIEVATLHRHYAYLPYPEIIDALHGVYASGLGVLATSSYFRGNVYRWGMTELDGAVSSNAPWPDVQFPYWMPWKLAHAARRGEILAGWECTMLMEPEPDFLEQVLVQRDGNLPHKFVMACFHPANTRKSPLVEGGTLAWVEAAIALARSREYQMSRYDHYICNLDKAVTPARALSVQ